MEYPSNERIEAAAVAAETWKEHGGRSCKLYYFNSDGFG